MEKRVSVRGIIIDGNELHTIFRRRVNDDETLDETLKRELKEELSIDVDIIGYLGFDENDTSIAHFFKCRIVSGIPILGGEELERCSRENYYEVRKVNICDLDSIDILAKDMIIKAYNNQFIKL